MLGVQLALLASRVSVLIKLAAVILQIAKATWICVLFLAFVSARMVFVPLAFKGVARHCSLRFKHGKRMAFGKLPYLNLIITLIYTLHNIIIQLCFPPLALKR
jgi:hypothetical protein